MQPERGFARPKGMKLLLQGLCATLLLLVSTAAAAAPPEREVKGNRLISQSDPAVSIQVPRSATYLGAERWDLYDLADCELHLFVEADRSKVVKALYWIQFEAYLPTNEHIYDYTKDEPVTFAGQPFWQRARFGPANQAPRAGSDGERVRQMVERAGYKLPAHSMSVRLVRVLDETKRKELMFIYGEDLTTQGYSSEQLLDGDQPRPAWEELKKGLLERARERLKVSWP